jgi:hypothetical protein
MTGCAISDEPVSSATTMLLQDNEKDNNNRKTKN